MMITSVIIFEATNHQVRNAVSSLGIRFAPNVKETHQSHQEETPHYKQSAISLADFPFLQDVDGLQSVALGVTGQGADWDGSEGGAVLDGGAVSTVQVPQGFDVS